MNYEIILGFIFLIVNLIGFYLAYLYGYKTKKFRWREYIAIIILPVASVFSLALLYGDKIISLYVLSCAIGFFLEYVIGLTYEKTLNKKLWVYKRLSVRGYTSLLSVPIWGVAGVVFWFLSKMVGL
jgi:uncharacterized membrane protein